MVRHIVFWNLKQAADGANPDENAARIKQRLEALVGQIDGLLVAQVTRGYNADGFDLCLYSEFTDKAALDFYQTHPLHVAVKEIVHQAITQRAVCDSEF